MLALAVLGMLLAGEPAALPPAQALPRIPGTTLRLGLSDSAAALRGFSALEGGARKGTCRFFGLQSEASLTFAEQRLARATFSVDEASTYETAYVQDQLTAMGYKRRCAKLQPGSSQCDWLGPVLVHLLVVGTKLSATVERAPAETTAVQAPPAALARVAPSPPRPDTGAALSPDTSRAAPATPRPVPLAPDTLAVPLPGRASPYPAAEVSRRGQCTYPEAARRSGIQGRVWVLATVDTSGRVLEAQVARGIAELNAAALCSARLWHFAPRTWQGQPCRYRVLVPITFTLH